MSEEKYCPTCGDYRQFSEVSRSETYEIRGITFSLPVTVLVCPECNESLWDEQRDGDLLERAYGEYRAVRGLLSPEKIKNIRAQYGLSQRSFAVLLGISEATINRYEGGALQDSAHDGLLRACENVEYVRGLLVRKGHLLGERQLERAKQSLAEVKNTQTGTKRMVEWFTYSGEASAQTGFRQFSYERYAATVTWLCRKLKTLSPTKLNKLLFYSDFLHFNTMTVSLTGSQYRKIQHGPVPALYGALNDCLEMDEYVKIEDKDYGPECDGEAITPGPRSSELNELDASAIAVLERIATRLGPLSAERLSKLSHLEPIWDRTVDKDLFDYTDAKDLSLSTANTINK